MLSTVARRWCRAAAIGVVLVLGGGLFSSGAATADRAVAEGATPRAAMQRSAQIELNYVYAVEETTSTIKKLGSRTSFPEGSFHAVLSGAGTAAPMKGELTLPPTEAYFVTFGFMPVTSTVTLQPTGATGTVDVELPKANIETDLSFYIKLSDVRVDGVPLDVGTNCRTMDPVRVHLAGSVYLTAGSPPAPLRATFTIPPFSGCGTSEDLNPLMTGLVSGPGNTMSTKLRVSCTAASYPCEVGSS